MSDGTQWLGWLAAALVLGGIEAATADFTFLMLAGGALAGSLAAALGAPFAVQAIVAVVVGLGLLVFARPLLKRRFRPERHLEIGASGLIGRRAHVVADVSSHTGQVKLAGEVWTARSSDGSVFAVGQEVVVIALDGATAIVASPAA